MYFASKACYINPDESESSDDDAAIQQNFTSNYTSMTSAQPRSARRSPAGGHGRHGGHKKKKHKQVGADTNVVALKFGTLVDKAAVFVGDAVVCSNNDCKGIFSVVSQLYDAKAEAKAQKEPENESQDGKAKASEKESKASEKAPEQIPELEEGQCLWKCEFCGTLNVIDEMEPEEAPSKDTYDYVLEPAPEDGKDSQASGESQPIIFVVDTSGSMCVTTEVSGTFQLKGQPTQQSFADEFSDDLMAEFRAEMNWNNRQRQQQRVSYVSRLQCVQAAVTQQLEDLKNISPDRKMSLVTFGADVTIIGDGSNTPVTVTGDKLANQTQLIQIGSQHTPGTGVGQSFEALSKQVWELAPSGATALGPALTIAVSMAADAPGTQVVLCTDGLANIGLGALDEKDDAKKEQVEQWYDGIGRLASAHGTKISVISIKGTECALEDLGRVCEITGGSVQRVDPLELSKNFSSVLSEPVIATNVMCRFLLHDALNFRNETKDVKNILVRDIGNVTANTEMMFEFHPGDHLQKYPNLTKVPFQLQVFYRTLEGMKLQRVISQTLQVTNDRKEAEAGAEVAILSANAIQQTSRLCQRGMYRHARKNNLRAARVLTRTAQTHDDASEQMEIVNTWAQDLGNVDDMLDQQDRGLRAELRSRGWDDLDSGSSDDDAPVRSEAKIIQRKAVKKARSRAAQQTRNDASYELMSRSSRATTSQYTSARPMRAPVPKSVTSMPPRSSARVSNRAFVRRGPRPGPARRRSRSRSGSPVVQSRARNDSNDN